MSVWLWSSPVAAVHSIGGGASGSTCCESVEHAATMIDAQARHLMRASFLRRGLERQHESLTCDGRAPTRRLVATPRSRAMPVQPDFGAVANQPIRPASTAPAPTAIKVFV